LARYGDQEVSQFRSAEMIATKWDISRLEMEQFALQSNDRAIHAIDDGRFDAQIAPVGEFRRDETPRRGTTLERMAVLQPLTPGGRLTAAVASQIADASAAILIASEGAVRRYGLKPRARIAHMSVRADDPVWMLTAPIPATRHALTRSGLRLEDIELIEINEAFASVVIAWERELGADRDRVNVNGGAIALGHPLGATGARLMTSLLSEMERRGARFGLQTMCEGGGQANVTVIERL
jgi:acetyl-CoA C-acetyltransferase